jgi:integrase
MTTTKQPNGRFWTRFRVEGEYFQRRFDREAEGKAWERTVTADLLRGEYVNETRDTFAEYAQMWMKLVGPRSAKSTMETRARTLRLHLLPAFGNRRLSKITRSQVQQFVNEKSEDYAPVTVVQGFYLMLVSIFQHAVDDRAIKETPCRKIKLPEIEERPPNIPTPEQVEIMADAIAPRYQFAVWGAAAAGLRRGETLGLCESIIDFDRGNVDIVRQLQTYRDDDGKRYKRLCPPKTKKSTRLIPVGNRFLDEARAHLDKWERGSNVHDDGTFYSDLVFSSRGGISVLTATFDQVWQTMQDKTTFDFRYHDLRHFYASALLRQGLSERTVADRLGHASTELLRIYAHAWHDDDVRTRDAMNEILPARSLRLVS